MTGEERDNESAGRRSESRREAAAPPSELGDVEDAVAEEVGGDLTEWAPPDQAKEGSDEATSGDTQAASRSRAGQPNPH